MRARATGADGSTITFADESTLDARTVIWATGFGVDYSYVDVLGWVKDDAQHIADQISKLSPVRVDTPDRPTAAVQLTS